MKYLGIPLNKVRIRNKDCKPYEDKLKRDVPVGRAG